MIFTNSDIFSIVQQFLSQTLSFEDGFLDRVKVDFNVTHKSYASFTFLAVYRNDSNSYTFTVQSDRGVTKSPEVELDVLCKYKQLYIFEELNFICLVFAGYLSLLVDLKASEAFVSCKCKHSHRQCHWKWFSVQALLHFPVWNSVIFATWSHRHSNKYWFIASCAHYLLRPELFWFEIAVWIGYRWDFTYIDISLYVALAQVLSVRENPLLRNWKSDYLVCRKLI